MRNWCSKKMSDTEIMNEINKNYKTEEKRKYLSLTPIEFFGFTDTTLVETKKIVDNVDLKPASFWQYGKEGKKRFIDPNIRGGSFGFLSKEQTSDVVEMYGLHFLTFCKSNYFQSPLMNSLKEAVYFDEEITKNNLKRITARVIKCEEGNNGFAWHRDSSPDGFTMFTIVVPIVCPQKGGEFLLKYANLSNGNMSFRYGNMDVRPDYKYSPCSGFVMFGQLEHAEMPVLKGTKILLQIKIPMKPLFIEKMVKTDHPSNPASTIFAYYECMLSGFFLKYPNDINNNNIRMFVKTYLPELEFKIELFKTEMNDNVNTIVDETKFLVQKIKDMIMEMDNMEQENMCEEMANIKTKTKILTGEVINIGSLSNKKYRDKLLAQCEEITKFLNEEGSVWNHIPLPIITDGALGTKMAPKWESVCFL